MDFISLIAEGSMKATALIIQNKSPGLKTEIEKLESIPKVQMAGMLCEALKKVITNEMDRILEAGKKNLEANIGPYWLKKWLNTECNDMAIKAIKEAAGEVAS